jgi:hypothetical protein
MDAPTSSKQGHNSRTGKVVKSKIELGVPYKEKDCCVLFYINSLLTTVKMHWFVDLEIIKG